MTPGRHVPLSVLVAVLLLVAISLGVLILHIARRAGPGERPADLTPTPALTVVDPTRPIALPPAPTATPVPEPILTTPTVTRVPTRTPTSEPTATETPAPTPERAPVQRG